VLAETDVINMVSRSIPPADILRGIHESMAERLIKLLKSIDVKQGVVMMTGGLALDTGLVKAIQDGMEKQAMGTRVATHPDSLYAGAIGAALWGAFRHEKLKNLGRLPKAS
jgi:benzoyl-CoA reductase subunit D